MEADPGGGSVAGGGAPVLVVGGGPTGLVAALLLNRYGVRCQLVERRAEPFGLPRAVHLDDEVQRVLQAAGVGERFSRIRRPSAGLRLLDARHRVVAEFSRSGDLGRHGHPPAATFDQPELEELLRDAVGGTGLTGVWTGVEVVAVAPSRDPAAPVSATVRDVASGALRPVPAAAVLGCDGAHSTVRGLVGAGWRELGFAQRWLVVDVRTDRPVGGWDGVEQVCDPARAATHLRVGRDRYRWEFRIHDGETVDGLADRLPGLLAPWLAADDIAAAEVLRVAGYTFHARVADRWRAGRVLLLGDAAHQTPPFVGQGLGLGLRDAHNLCWKLARVLVGRAPEELLDTYPVERIPQTRHLIRQAVVAGWAMTGGGGSGTGGPGGRGAVRGAGRRAAAARRVAIRALCRVPGLPSRVLDRPLPRLTGPLADREHRALWSPGRSTVRSPVGSMVPQPVVTVAGRSRPLDDVLGPGFALLSLGEPDALLAGRARRLGARVVRLVPPGIDAGSDGDSAEADVGTDGDTGVGRGVDGPVADRDGVLTAWLRRERCSGVLLRPDRVVLDTAPRGGGCDGRPGWAGLLLTGRNAMWTNSSTSG